MHAAKNPSFADLKPLGLGLVLAALSIDLGFLARTPTMPAFRAFSFSLLTVLILASLAALLLRLMRWDVLAILLSTALGSAALVVVVAFWRFIE